MKAKTISVNISDYKVLKGICAKYKLSIRDLLHRLAIYPEFTKNALQLPPEITLEAISNVATMDKLLPMWLENIRNNFEKIKTGKDIADIPHKNEPALIIGAGPSLVRKKHLELLAEKGFNGTIFAADSILKSCLEHGIIPHYVLTLDGSEKILPYLNHDIIDDHANKMGAIICVSAHPTVVKRWKGEIFWFENSVGDAVLPNVARTINLLCKKTELMTAGHVSSAGWSVAFARGRNPIVLIGVDLSYPMDVPIEKTWYFDEYMKYFSNDIKKVRDVYKNYYHHTAFGTDCYCDRGVFLPYRNYSLMQCKAASEKGVRMINCTEGGSLEGEGLECMKFEEYLDSQKGNKK